MCRAPARCERALKSGADGVIIDLEDAVAPGDKIAARAHVAAFLQTYSGDERIAVRINSLSTQWGPDDLAALSAVAGLAAIMAPKAETTAQIAEVSSALDSGVAEAGVIALVETARGVAQVETIADAGGRLCGLMFGAADYAADLGVEAAALNADYARARIVNAAAAAGVTAIDAPFFDIRDIQGLQQDCRHARGLGFGAKAAIHPSQVQTIVETFAPSATEIDRARRILNSLQDGVAVVDGKMIDEAMARWAKRILRQN
ncbi:MAG: aldolase/citrate lyase family protein [Parvularculaceae bacterium]